MAENRTNMVSLLDIGLLFKGTKSNIIEMGDGFSEITEDWGPETESKTYVNMNSASNSIKGYALSMSPERDYLSDDMQKAIDDMFKKFPTGEDAETYYYRFFKTDLTGNTGDCIRVPVTVCPSSVGGSGGESLTSTIQINGNGEVEQGTITVSESGFAWAAKAASKANAS